MSKTVKFLVVNNQSYVIIVDYYKIQLKYLVSKKSFYRRNRINNQQVYQIYKKLEDYIFDNKVPNFSKMPTFIEKMQLSAYASLEIDKHSFFS